MKRNGILTCLSIFLSMTVVAVFGAPAAVAATNPTAICIPWHGAVLTDPHPVISGVPTTVKGVASPTAKFYSWTFGDGGSVARTAIVDNNAISAAHTYTGAVGATFTATLTVYDASNRTGTSTYKVQVVSDTLQARTNVSIDAALWWTHTHLSRYNFDNNSAWPSASVENGGTDSGVLTVASALQAFEKRGHLPTGNAATDPYSGDTKLLLNEIGRHLFVKNVETKENGQKIDTNSDGLMMGPFDSYPDYEPGLILKALVDAGVGAQRPFFGNAALNFTGNSSKAITNYTWSNVIKNLIDYIAWAQLHTYPIVYPTNWVYDSVNDKWNLVMEAPYKDNAVTNMSGISRGSWGYWGGGWNDPKSGRNGGWGDIAMAFWMTRGLSAAKAQGFTIPGIIDTELNLFTAKANKIQNLDNTLDPNYGVVYFGPNNPSIEDPEFPGVYFQANYFLVERSAELVSVLNYLGFNQSDERVAAALAFVDKHWKDHNFSIAQNAARPYVDTWVLDDLGNWTLSRNYARDDNQISFIKRLSNLDLDAQKTGWDWNGEAPGYYGIGTASVSNLSGGKNYNFFHPYAADNTSILWGYEEGNWIPSPSDNTVMIWQKTRTGDELNIFAYYALSQAMAPYGATTFPSTASEPLGWEGRIMTLLSSNQLSNGGYDEQNWIQGDPFGTPWALMTMTEKGTLAAVTPLAMTRSTSSSTEHLVTKVKVVNGANAVVAGAAVTGTLKRGTTTLKSNWTATTDSTGTASFDYSVNKQLLPAGTYTFTVNTVSKATTPVSVWNQAPGAVTGTLVK